MNTFLFLGLQPKHTIPWQIIIHFEEDKIASDSTITKMTPYCSMLLKNKRPQLFLLQRKLFRIRRESLNESEFVSNE